MKKNKFVLSVFMCFAISLCYSQNEVKSVNFVDSENKTNNFYDNSEVITLNISDLYVGGEVANPGKVDFSKLKTHELIVKETVLENNKSKFVGAYRYIGFSLADILNSFIVKKMNEVEFPPLIDLYIEIENDKNEKVVISWGEIYYPNQLHEIIIASGVARIIPDKTKDMWILPEQPKLIICNDLITERNLSNPVKITVKTFSGNDIKIIKDKQPLFSPTVDIVVNDKTVKTYSADSDYSKSKSLHTIFYGKGRGLHSTEPFSGLSLKNVLEGSIEFNNESLKKGLVVVVADDGYRSVYSYSELCNRNDQSEVLLICNPKLTDKGIFRLFPSCDFFSDRAVKGISKILFIK